MAEPSMVGSLPAGIDPVELLILQGSPFCNIDCRYCYLPARSDTRRMPLDLLETIAQRVLGSGLTAGEVRVLWHAGEPLVLGVPYYESALEILRRATPPSVRVRPAFQTNATLVDERWARFFAAQRGHLDLGVSLDGPAFLHDRERVTRSGRPTHALVMAGVRRLQEQEVPFSVITVLTNASLDHADALVDFYLEQGIRAVGFNFEDVEGVHARSSLGVATAGERARAFLRRVLERTAHDGRLVVREFDRCVRFVRDGEGELDSTQENRALRILTVDVEGEVSTFSPELLGAEAPAHGNFAIGNLTRQTLAEIACGLPLAELVREVDEGVKACRATCGHFGVCGGGRPGNKWFENGSLRSTETGYCRLSRMAVADVVLEHLERGLGLERRR